MNVPAFAEARRQEAHRYEVVTAAINGLEKVQEEPGQQSPPTMSICDGTSSNQVLCCCAAVLAMTGGDCRRVVGSASEVMWLNKVVTRCVAVLLPSLDNACCRWKWRGS